MIQVWTLLLLLLLKNKVENYALSDVVCRLYQSVLYFNDVIHIYGTWIDEILFKPTVKAWHSLS
jgi:hypothetical protein